MKRWAGKWTYVLSTGLALLLASCGGGGGGSSNTSPGQTTPTASLALFAGNLVVATGGSTNGTGAAASFNGPTAVATDSAGNVYVSDQNNYIIRKITPAGVVSTFAGTGSYGFADGPGTQASFGPPQGIATDGAGNVYVADSANNTIRKITAAGQVSTFAGVAPNVGVTSSGSSDSTGTGPAGALFNTPRGIASDHAGNLYVADMQNATIRKILPDGTVSTLAGTVGSTTHTDSTGTGPAGATFFLPTSVAVDSSGNVYVAEANNPNLRKIAPDGTVSTITSVTFTAPEGLAVDSADNLYVSDSNSVVKLTPGGVATTLAGTAGVSGSADGSGANASFNNPAGLATDSAGNVYVADSSNNVIRKITAAAP